MVLVVGIYPAIVVVAVSARKRRDDVIMEQSRGESFTSGKEEGGDWWRTISYLWKIRGVRTLTLLILAVFAFLLLWPVEYLYAITTKDERYIGLEM